MPLIVEDGSGVAGANALATPQFVAEYLADRGDDLVVERTLSTSAATFAAGSVSFTGITAATVPAGSIVRVEGAGEEENVGYAYVDSVNDGTHTATLSWLTGATEAPGASVVLTVYALEGWTGTRQRLEGSIMNASEYLSTAYAWLGVPVTDGQGMPFPRSYLYAGSGSPYYVVGFEFPDDAVPTAVKAAIARLAVQDLSEPLLDPVDPKTQLKSKTIGPISKVYDNPQGRVRYTAIDRMLRGLYQITSSQRRTLVRI